MFKRPKVTIVGAGATGSATAHRIAAMGLGDVVLLDVVPGIPQGRALDLQQAAPLEGFDARITGTNDYADTAGSDVVVITAGSPRKPGMTREDLLRVNYAIVKSVTENIVRYSPDCYLIVLTNPLDVMTYVAYKESGFDASKVMGQSGILDSARFRTFLALELGVALEDTSAIVLGGHGDAMLPLPRYASVGGVPVEQLLSSDAILKIVERTRNGGGEIVNLLKTGSASYAPGAAVAEMVEAIVRNKKRVLPVAAYLNGEYGHTDVYAGVPVVLGGNGVEKVIELELTTVEKEEFGKSIQVIKTNIYMLYGGEDAGERVC